MLSCVSLTELTTAAAWILGLSIAALIAAGWRKPARATVPVARGRRSARPRAGVPVVDTSAAAPASTSPWRRIWAVVAGSTLALVTGAIVAITVALSLGYIVITLSHKLGR